MKTLLVLLLTPLVGYGQQVKDPVLDGTQGEVFREVNDSVMQPVPKMKGYEFDGPWSSLKFGGGFLYEYAGFSQDEASAQQVNMESNFKVRDFRFVMAGKLKLKNQITWKAGFMYDGQEKKWLMRESGVMFNIPKISGNIFIGRTKEGYSLSKVMNGYSIWFMERLVAIDVIPILADGIKYMGYFPKQHIFWNLGAFTDWMSEGQSFSTYNWTFVTRVAWLPIYQDMTKPVLHIGIGYRYGDVDNDVIQVRSKPEVSGSPYFVDTKPFAATYSNSINGEVYFRSGPLTIGSEYHAHMFHTPENGDELFTGSEVFAAYVLTGEIKPYYSSGGIFGFLNVNRSVFKGGKGAIEALMRFTNLDLEDRLVKGGDMWRITPALNWYMSNNIKVSFQYGFTVLNRFDLKGETNIFQSRVMLHF
ncbi:MAG TPA: porin [Bacteroidia bacterium]|nr:porin [Bacteroidia bacterium]